MKTILLNLLSISMLFVMTLSSMAQSDRLDSLQHVNNSLLQQSELLQPQYDSIYRIFAQCKTDEERLVQIAAIEKLNKQAQQIGNKVRKIEEEIKIEKEKGEEYEGDKRKQYKQKKEEL